MKARLLGRPSDYLFSEEVWLDRRDSEPLHSLHLVEAAQKVEKTLAVVFAIFSDVDSGYHNLLAPSVATRRAMSTSSGVVPDGSALGQKVWCNMCRNSRTRLALLKISRSVSSLARGLKLVIDKDGVTSTRFFLSAIHAPI